jgi:uncharacterized protein with LGFP repeats
MFGRAFVLQMRVGLLVLAAAFLASLVFSAPDRALAEAAADSGIACGVDLSGPIYAKWREMLGETGRLGCPTTKELDSQKTPYGAGGRIGTFVGRDKLGAAIVWHASGPHAGQTAAVYGCIYRLYMQYGGPASWLGLPTADPANTPDGQVQPFEGGLITMFRAGNECHATRSAEAPPHIAASDASPKAALDLFFDPARGDYLTTATVAGVEAAAAAHYQRIRNEAYVFTEKGPGLTALKLFWNEARGDNATVGTAEGEQQMLGAGYEFGGTQGYVYSDPQPGAKPLKLFWNAERHDFLLTATPEGEADAAGNGYKFVRIEGYAPPSP